MVICKLAPCGENLVTETAVRDDAALRTGLDEEALFREARRLRRRRWAIRATIVLALIIIAATIAWLSAARGHSQFADRDHATGALPNGPLASLHVAGALAVGSTGALYVADAARHRVLVRLADGRFRVIAGTGISGYSGDGGSALRADLSTVSDLAFSPMGSLYLVDGGRVRVIGPNGIITTIAGDGRPARQITRGTPARSAALGTARQNAGPSIAVAPDGELYIATSRQVLRLSAYGTLLPVRDVAATAPVHGSLDGLGNIAVDGHGNIDVSGVDGWSVWEITRGGQAHEVGPGSGARQSGGNDSVLQRAPDGTVYAENGPAILRVTPDRLLPAFRITKVDHEYFTPTHFAFGARGETYLDEIPGDNGFEAHQQLISIRDAHTTLLWQERNRGTHDSFGPG
jgi:hypothetical protein